MNIPKKIAISPNASFAIPYVPIHRITRILHKMSIAILSLLLVSCMRLNPSLVDTAQNLATLAAEIFLTLGTGTLTGTGSETQVAALTFSPSAGHYSTAQKITISTTTSGASIYYTTDGSPPTTSSTLYTEPRHIWSLAGKTIKAIAVKTGLTDSDAATSGVYSYSTLKTGQTLCWQILEIAKHSEVGDTC